MLHTLYTTVVVVVVVVVFVIFVFVLVVFVVYCCCYCCCCYFFVSTVSGGNSYPRPWRHVETILFLAKMMRTADGEYRALFPQSTCCGLCVLKTPVRSYS